jgi:hypothetical protein
MQKSGSKNTAPIKLKRPTSSIASVSEDWFVFVSTKKFCWSYLEQWSRRK